VCYPLGCGVGAKYGWREVGCRGGCYEDRGTNEPSFLNGSGGPGGERGEEIY
jgi:hypothetical protein